MKTIILVLLTSSVFAQDYGVYSGALVSDVRNSTYKAALNSTFGVFAAFKNGNSSFNIEPGIITKGGLTQKLNYVSLPITTSRHFNKFRFDVGLEMSKLLSNTYYNKLEISTLTGLSYELGLFDVSLRLGYGLTPTVINTMTDDNAQVVTGSKEYNVYGLLMVRYSI